MNARASISAVFHRTKDGLLGARVGGTMFLGLPRVLGKFIVAYGSGIDKPPECWVASDFYGRAKMVEGEDGFRGYVEAQAEHERQLGALERREVRGHAQTPWGCADFAYEYAQGIVRHSTPSHGGFHLDAERNAFVHAQWRDAGGWYEEDCDWAKVAAAFPLLFTDEERRAAEESLRHWQPDAYERIRGVTLAPGQSYLKDKRCFQREHAAHWVVISATRSAQRLGYVECVATLGANRGAGEERRFVIPKDEYEPGPFGFVIDPSRHETCEPPSVFAEGRR